MRFGKATILAFGIGFLPAASAHAWKPITHAYLAQQVVDELIANDGYLEIETVNVQSGGLEAKKRKYKAVPELYQAVKKHPAIFYNGVVGPDSYPDILTGQNIIHPPKEEGMGTDHWWKALWAKTHDGPYAKPQNLAFMMGMYAHSAGDMFAHSFVNAYTGGPFEFIDNAVQHIALEGYLFQRTPALALHQGTSVYDLVAKEGMNDELAKFIRNALDPYEGLSHHVGKGHVKSIPWHFAKLRKGLIDSIADLDAKLVAWHIEYKNREKLWDEVAVPAGKKKGESLADYVVRKAKIATRVDDLVVAAFMDGVVGAAVRDAVIPYMKAWAADIETGLIEWPKVSHQIGMALMFQNPTKKVTTEQTFNAVLEPLLMYWVGNGKTGGYGLKMIGLPDKIVDALGAAQSNMTKAEKALMGIINTLLEPLKKMAAVPKKILDEVLAPFKPYMNGLKMDAKAFAKFLLKEATGVDYDEAKAAVKNFDYKELAIDLLFAVKKQPKARLENGHTLTIAHVNKVMGLGPVGTKGDDRFKYRDFAPAFNTVNMIKLAFLGVDETNHLVQSLGGAQTLTAKNVMLGGWLDSMDAGNQWLYGDKLVYARDCSLFRKLFLPQAVPTASQHEPAESCLEAQWDKLPKPAPGSRPPPSALLAFGQSHVELESGKPHRFDLYGQFKSFSLSLDAGGEPTGSITGKDAKGFTYTPPKTTNKEFDVDFVASDETNYDAMLKVHVIPALDIAPAIASVGAGESETFGVTTQRRVVFRVAKGRGHFGNRAVLAKLRQEQAALKTANFTGPFQFALMAGIPVENQRLADAIKKEEATYYAPADAKEGEQVTIEAVVGRGNKEGDRTVSLSFVLGAKDAERDAELAKLVASKPWLQAGLQGAAALEVEARKGIVLRSSFKLFDLGPVGAGATMVAPGVGGAMVGPAALPPVPAAPPARRTNGRSATPAPAEEPAPTRRPATEEPAEPTRPTRGR